MKISLDNLTYIHEDMLLRVMVPRNKRKNRFFKDGKNFYKPFRIFSWEENDFILS